MQVLFLRLELSRQYFSTLGQSPKTPDTEPYFAGGLLSCSNDFRARRCRDCHFRQKYAYN